MSDKIYYQKLKNFIERHGIDINTRVTSKGYSLTIGQYITAVSKRDKQRRILESMKLCENKEALLAYLQGAISSVISRTIAKLPGYPDYYDNKLKKVN